MVKTYAVVDGETIDEAWVKYELELCSTWIQVITEKYADGKPNEEVQPINSRMPSMYIQFNFK